TVYWNYIGDNGGMLLNPQRFHSSMPSIFGPGECYTVLKTIFDSCIKCSFQPTSFINRILDLFPSINDNKKISSTQIKLENGTIVNIPNIENEDDFWEIIRMFQNGILAGNDLFISTLPHSTMNQSNGSSSSFLDSSLSPDKKEISSSLNQNIKRKSTELKSENKTFLTNGKVPKVTSTENSVYDTKPLLNAHPSHNTNLTNNNVQNGGTSSNVIPRRPERFTPSDVAAFVRGIDPSFDSLASRFLQEEIDGKALLLLTTDTLMRHMGLKLGPSLKIVHHIEKLKKPLLNAHPSHNTNLTNNNVQNGGTSSNVIPRRPERFTPSDVAAFVRGIDPSFDSLASRFLQEEIDGKALLLLTTDTLMRHMGLKLGPSLKIVHHIEKLKS
ncbi:unnamed protein product, partial [Rotaria sp. Silwood1]